MGYKWYSLPLLILLCKLFDSFRSRIPVNVEHCLLHTVGARSVPQLDVGRVVFIIGLGACFSGLGGGSTRPPLSDSLAGAFRDALCALCMVAEAQL